MLLCSVMVQCVQRSAGLSAHGRWRGACAGACARSSTKVRAQDEGAQGAERRASECACAGGGGGLQMHAPCVRPTLQSRAAAAAAGGGARVHSARLHARVQAAPKNPSAHALAPLALEGRAPLARLEPRMHAPSRRSVLRLSLLCAKRATVTPSNSPVICSHLPSSRAAGTLASRWNGVERG